MMILFRFLASELSEDLFLSTSITKLDKIKSLWYLEGANRRRFGPFVSVVLALTPELALDILPIDTSLQQSLQSVHMRPCWTVIAVAAPCAVSNSFSAAFLNDSDIGFIVRNNSKPQRQTLNGSGIARAILSRFLCFFRLFIISR